MSGAPKEAIQISMIRIDSNVHEVADDTMEGELFEVEVSVQLSTHVVVRRVLFCHPSLSCQ